MKTYRVWCEERGGDASTARFVKADSHSEAAEKWAHEIDWSTNEYEIVKGASARVQVCSEEDFKAGYKEGGIGCIATKTFNVTGRSERVYTAREVKQ